jgi:hypothetical protein
MRMLTKEDLLFLKRAEGLEGIFVKLGTIKQLILEARTEMAAAVKAFGKMKAPVKTKAAKVIRARKEPMSFGLNAPDALTDTERKVYAELQKAGVEGRKPRELCEALKITTPILGRATRSLKKRKLITSTGATVNLTWKVR